MTHRVLVVEDDADMRGLVCDILALDGLTPVPVPDGTSALTCMSETPVDLVVLDVSLPGRTGYSVLDEIRHTPALRALTVVLLTAGGQHGLVQGLRAGADDYISKPFEVDELLARVHAHLRARERWRESVGRASTIPTAHLRALCEQRSFDIAYQPIVELISMNTVGHEALARFRDGQSPAEMFAAATAVGLGVALELAAAGLALESAGHLPADSWLSLNLSPAALLASEPLQAPIGLCSRPVIIELTEHERVEDYPALTKAAQRLGPAIQLAVDDAGAGYASLSHVVALHPALVKLDRAWVDGISYDLVRQALVRGVLGVANATGSAVVAEGIEQAEDLEVVQELGVALGQGFLLGRPTVAA